MADLRKLISPAEELSLHVEELNEENLTECVYLSLLPTYISTDIYDIVKVATNRSGVVVSATYNGVDEARALYDKLVKYFRAVITMYRTLTFICLSAVVSPTSPSMRNWPRYGFGMRQRFIILTKTLLPDCGTIPTRKESCPRCCWWPLFRMRPHLSRKTSWALSSWNRRSELILFSNCITNPGRINYDGSFCM